MPSGFAYAKRYRTCKSCIGTDYCRYGLGDSMGLAQQVEARFQGLDTPGKLKLATAGCPRNCSEAMVKDVGAVAVDGGKWELYVGGAAGAHVRKGDLLCTVGSHAEVLRNLRPLHPVLPRERQVPRAHLRLRRARRHRQDPRRGRSTTARIAESLDRALDRSVEAYRDPWQEALTPATPNPVRVASTPLSSEEATAMEITLGPVSAIPEGEGRTFDTGRYRIAVFRSRDGSVFATQAECPHRQDRSPMALLGGRTSICPLHSWKFDLATGRPQRRRAISRPIRRA